MRGFSKAVVSGNLTRDPEMRSTTSGMQVCALTIAVNRGPAKDGAEQVSYIDCSAWGKTAETLCQYLKKGSPLIVSGRLNQQSWTDKSSGQKRSKLEVIVDDFTFLGGDNSTQSKSSSKSSSHGADEEPEVIPDDIPDEDAEVSLDEIPF